MTSRSTETPPRRAADDDHAHAERDVLSPAPELPSEAVPASLGARSPHGDWGHEPTMWKELLRYHFNIRRSDEE